MGPYIIRSWNASIKGYEDAVVDSYEDPLVPALPIGPNECACEYRPACDVAPCCGYGGCGAGQATEVSICDPLGCQPTTVRCSNDPDCCTPWVPMLKPMSCGVNSGCPDGEVRQERICGGSREERCFPDKECIFACQGYIPPAYIGTTCPGSNLRLPGNIDITTSTSCSGIKCQIRCNPPYIPQFNNSICACPPGTYDPGQGCPRGFTPRGRCPPGSYEIGFVCGDSICNGSETCFNCEGDCGGCAPCGDGSCTGTEHCSNCPIDCGVCW